METQKSNTPWTPGPWSLEYDGALVMGGQVVGRAPHPDFAPEQRLPNARLIAAAPEMAELLAEMAEDDRVPCEYAEEIDALLAKIKGDANVQS